MSDISKRLTKYRKAAKLSQEEVADKLNVSRQTVSKWETGQSTPDFDKIAPLCELYNITTDELLRGVVEPKKKEEEPEEGEVVDEDKDDDDDDDDDECCNKHHCHKPKSANAVIVHCVFTILALVTVIIYLGISFSTHMWHITWIIWLIYAMIVTFIKLIFAIFGVYVDEDYGAERISRPKNYGHRIFGLIVAFFVLFLLVGFIGALFVMPGNMFFGINKGLSDTLSYDKTYDVDFKTLKISAKAGEVNVKETAANELRVVIFSDEKKEYEIKQNEDIFKIDVENDGCRGFACFSYKVPKVEVYLPENYADKIEIKNNYGDINVGSFNKASVDIDEDMGKVSVKSAKELKIKNNMGATEINKVSSMIDAKASMGSINIEELNLDQNSNIEASMGSININKTNDIYINADADMGSANVAKNNRESKVELKVRCSMGSINIGD